ncbi:Hypothetical protein, putative [Bodo saltans]|uniref:Membrane-associated protein n=1 Tax=Bodo saltans TaxID=75058 RepID=A0A0S4KK55_BODSA|nr:Hypothetical protein, putative [Bodo saltans]|eukprot:CUI15373.1 Hypothetical protein, putative [Bodo saltans]
MSKALVASMLMVCLVTVMEPTTATTTFTTNPIGFLALTSPGYQYGPTVMLVGDSYVAMWCSPGVNGAWDAIRMSISPDLQTWGEAAIILTPQSGYDSNSVCDPSLVSYRGQWFLYHTCINTANPPDGYTNNRICVAVADSVLGPYYSKSYPVIQDLNCTKDYTAAYCVGQPSALVAPDGKGVLVYYSKVTTADTTPPNPGKIYVAYAPDGLTFSPYTDGAVYPQRDVDVKYDRWSRQFVMVQGDVGSSTLTYSTSPDGIHWSAYAEPQRIISTNPNLPSGGTNNNPGLVGLPDGSFDGMTTVIYGSSVTVGWGDWKLYASSGVLNTTTSDCLTCAENSCDFACRDASGTKEGKCAAPMSRNGLDCCDCVPRVFPAACENCVAGGDCVAGCRLLGYATGVCASPGGTNPLACCSCVH